MVKNTFLEASQRHAALPAGAHEIPDSVAVVLIAHRSTIHAACTLLNAYLTDLERNGETRSESFWHEVLDSLHGIRAALAPVLAVTHAWNVRAMDDATSRFLLTLGHADGLVDRVGITVTTYVPVCDSRTETNMQKRSAVVAVLRELVHAVQDVVNALERGREKGGNVQ